MYFVGTKGDSPTLNIQATFVGGLPLPEEIGERLCPDQVTLVNHL